MGRQAGRLAASFFLLAGNEQTFVLQTLYKYEVCERLTKILSHRINNSSQSDSQLQDEGGLEQRTGPAAAAAASATYNVPFMLHLFGTSFH